MLRFDPLILTKLQPAVALVNYIDLCDDIIYEIKLRLATIYAHVVAENFDNIFHGLVSGHRLKIIATGGSRDLKTIDNYVNRRRYISIMESNEIYDVEIYNKHGRNIDRQNHDRNHTKNIIHEAMLAGLKAKIVDKYGGQEI